MTVQARDVPGQIASSRFATIQVTVNVRRNPNAPVFLQSLYNLTISEYISVQDLVVSVSATDADSAFTNSGRIRYKIIQASYTPPNQFAQFVISESAGGIYLSQPLTRDGIPNSFSLIVQAEDSATNPKSATATVSINVVRNIHTPIFNPNNYTAQVYDASAIGTSLFTVTATDGDRLEPYNRDVSPRRFQREKFGEFCFSAVLLLSAFSCKKKFCLILWECIQMVSQLFIRQNYTVYIMLIALPCRLLMQSLTT